jgi:hypothetical protein
VDRWRRLELPEDLPFADWRDIGTQLGRARDQFRWWVADWWRFGIRKYGEGRLIAEEWGGLSYQSCRDLAWVAGRFELSRRRGGLSFFHHREVAALEPDEADRLLDWCFEDRGRTRSRAELRERVRRLEAEKIEKKAQRLVVYKEPPRPGSRSIACRVSGAWIARIMIARTNSTVLPDRAPP